MKKLFLYAATLLTSIVIVAACASSEPKDPNEGNDPAGGSGSEQPSQPDEPDVPEPQLFNQVLTYVWSGGDIMPDPALVDAINYSFGSVNALKNGVTIANESRFKKVIDLKKDKPELKVILCIGGNCASGFSVMCASNAKRNAFAADCGRIVKEYGIDGIDFDWEFPGGEGGTERDPDNFVLLIKAVREAIGKNKILSISGGGDLNGVKAKEVMPYVSYFNVMAYDLGTAPYHHTTLYRSRITGWRSVHEVVNDYIAQGVPYEKMMLGLGFYGRGDGKNFEQWTSYRDVKVTGDLTEQWDAAAYVPYIADAEGNLVLGYDNPESIARKCKYAKDKGMRGVMCWRTETDKMDLELARTVADCMKK